MLLRAYCNVWKSVLAKKYMIFSVRDVLLLRVALNISQKINLIVLRNAQDITFLTTKKGKK